MKYEVIHESIDQIPGHIIFTDKAKNKIKSSVYKTLLTVSIFTGKHYVTKKTNPYKKYDTEKTNTN
jgi:hypothetical protein